jgi:uncharacterized membrane protein
MDNRKSLRTLYIVQLVTIIILVLLLIQQVLPFFGILPIGAHPQIIQPGPQSVPNGGYTSPTGQDVGSINGTELALHLN